MKHEPQQKTGLWACCPELTSEEVVLYMQLLNQGTFQQLLSRTFHASEA